MFCYIDINLNKIYQVHKTVRVTNLLVISTTHANLCAVKGSYSTQESGQTST